MADSASFLETAGGRGVRIKFCLLSSKTLSAALVDSGEDSCCCCFPLPLQHFFTCSGATTPSSQQSTSAEREVGNALWLWETRGGLGSKEGASSLNIGLRVPSHPPSIMHRSSCILKFSQSRKSLIITLV